MMAAEQTGQRIEKCPCGSGASFAECCSPCLEGTETPATAESLMRSRYSAYATHQQDYLLKSWHPDTRPGELVLNTEQRWLGLKVLATDAGGAADQEGIVEFVARFKVAGRGHRLHEISRFLRTADGWRYLDGKRGSTDSSLKG